MNIFFVLIGLSILVGAIITGLRLGKGKEGRGKRTLEFALSCYGIYLLGGNIVMALTLPYLPVLLPLTLFLILPILGLRDFIKWYKTTNPVFADNEQASFGKFISAESVVNEKSQYGVLAEPKNYSYFHDYCLILADITMIFLGVVKIILASGLTLDSVILLIGGIVFLIPSIRALIKKKEEEAEEQANKRWDEHQTVIAGLMKTVKEDRRTCSKPITVHLVYDNISIDRELSPQLNGQVMEKFQIGRPEYVRVTKQVRNALYFLYLDACLVFDVPPDAEGEVEVHLSRNSGTFALSLPNKTDEQSCDQCQSREEEYCASPAPASEAEKQTPEGKTYYERDNMGTRHDTMSQATAYWMGERMGLKVKPPFTLYIMPSIQAGEEALLELPFMHRAADSGKLISERLMTFGVYATTTNGVPDGQCEAMITGSDLTLDEYKTVEAAMTRLGGTCKNHSEPSASVKSSEAVGDASRVVYAETVKGNDGVSVYEVYKGPDKASAMAFLKGKPVTTRMRYVVVDTPEGSFGRDINGFYQE